MSHESLRDFVRSLEREGDLKRVPFPVDPRFEMTDLCQRSLKAGGPALLFEQPAGSGIPVLGNLFGTQRRVAAALGYADVKQFREVGETLAFLREPHWPDRPREALGRLPVGLLLTNAHGLLTYANPAATALLGRAPRSGEPLAESLGGGDATHAALRRLLAGGESRARTDGIHRGDGHLRTELHALRDAEGDIGGILAVLGTDPGSLDTASLALVPELIEALGAPITSIMGYSHLIRQGKGVFQGEGQLERYLERIDANLSHLKVTLANLAMVLDGGGDAWEHSQAGEPLDLADRLDQAMERMQHQLREKGLRAERIGEAPGGLLGDGAVVDLLLDNLLVHAIQRSPMGGDLQVAARGDGERLVLEVQDRGRVPEGGGLPPEQPVSLSDATVGVELKAAQLLAARQGGQVWLRPEEGGLRGCASLRVREARLPHEARPTDD
jgi:signal transduction histidine kinase